MNKSLSIEASCILEKKAQARKEKLDNLVRTLSYIRKDIEEEQDDMNRAHLMMDENLILREIKQILSYMSPLMTTDLFEFEKKSPLFQESKEKRGFRQSIGRTHGKSTIL